MMVIEVKSKKDIESFEIYGEREKREKSPIKRWEKKVKDLCLNDERALKDDVYLYIKFLEATGQAKLEFFEDDARITIKKEKLLNGGLTKPETISRLRRKLKEDEKIDYGESLKENREFMEKEYRKYFGKKSNFDEMERFGVF